MPKHLVIVESPTKARTIKRFLGKDYVVEASMGHVRDLPGSTLGVDVENDFTPVYEVSEGKESVVKNLKTLLKGCDDLLVATDEDREGEAIGWHLLQLLDPKGKIPVQRIVFHEITEQALKHAVEHPRLLDQKLVAAQESRRILDRLVGYTLSPFLWKKVYSGLSAGRVQSVAVRIVVDREKEIRAFNPVEYWSITANLETKDGEAFTAELDREGKEKLAVSSKEQADKVLEALRGKNFSVGSLDEKEVKRSPPAPFTTSTLQQEASRKLGFSVKQTMVVAQQLYEGISMGKGEGSTGLITYMRTDSVNLSDKALGDAKETIEKHFGREYVLSEARKYKTKSKGAQEAHEAIRPTEMSRSPMSLQDELDPQQMKLYTLIWNRTLATQMPQAEFKRVGADIDAGDYTFRATGQTVIFDGYLRVYSEGKDEPAEGEQQEEDGEKRLPKLSKGQELSCSEIVPAQHFTKPPARYTEASLVKKLEEEGIGRPSTYAPTISTVIARGYIRKDGKALVPEDIAFTVTDLLAEHFPDIVDLQFTAKMEQQLDDIAEGNEEEVKFLRGFFIPFKKLIDTKTKEISKKDVLKERVVGIDPDSGKEVIVRTGRFGPYVQLGRLEETPKGEKKKKAADLKTASLPKHISTDVVSLDQALALLSFPRVLGKHEGQDVTVFLGRFGPYVKWGDQSATLPKDMEPLSVTLESGIDMIKNKAELKKMAAQPLRELGKNADGKDVSVKNGRYGPYITDGETNVSVPKRFTPETITLEEALELIEKKKTSPRRGPWGKGRAKK